MAAWITSVVCSTDAGILTDFPLFFPPPAAWQVGQRGPFQLAYGRFECVFLLRTRATHKVRIWLA